MLKDQFIRRAVKMTAIITAKAFAYIFASITVVIAVTGFFIACKTPADFMDIAFMPILLFIVSATIVYFTREALKKVTRYKL